MSHLEQCKELSECYLLGVLKKRNEVSLLKLVFHPLKPLRLMILNRRVRKAIRLLAALNQSGEVI